MLAQVPPLLWLLFFLLFVVKESHAAPLKRKDGNPFSRSIRVLNESGVKIDLFWVHVVTGELADSHTDGDGIVYGGETGISSYVGHTFQVIELPNDTTHQCLSKECQTVQFTCNENDDQVVTILKNFTVSIADNKSRALDTAKSALNKCETPDSSLPVSRQLELLSECLEVQAQRELDHTRDEIRFQAEIRKEMGSKLQTYSCETDKFESVNVTTTPSILNSTYGLDSPVETLFESDHSSIRLFRDFLTPSQCQRVLQQKEFVSHSFQKTKTPDFEMDVVVSKLQELAQSVLSLPDDYFSNTVNHDILVHVDNGSSGTCDAEGKNCGTIIDDGATTAARILVYCTSADEMIRGGVIFFPNAGVRIVPASGQAVLVLYENHRGVRDDDPYVDQYTVCPVVSGTVVTLEDVYRVQ